MRGKDSLAKYLKKKVDSSDNTREYDEELIFLHKFASVHQEPSKGIPQFYYSSAEPSNVLGQKLREEARARLLKSREEELLTNSELKTLWTVLDSNSLSDSDSGEDDTGYFTYTEFKAVQKEINPKCRGFFKARLFCELMNEENGRLSVLSLFNYVMRKVWLRQTRIELSLYDGDGDGFLRESNLENYISELIETLPHLESLEKSLHTFYVCAAVRKFFFFLDPVRTGQIRIRDILASGFLDELLELRDKDLGKESQETNWFSAPTALRVYGQYLNLDSDHNGMLSPEELKKYGTGTLTDAFVERVFQECLTYEGEMDYKTYIDFVLALENRKEPQSIQYFFRIFDVYQKGYLDAFTLNYFFRDILKEMQKLNQEPVLFEDVKDEIFDMVRPKDPSRITLADLIASKQGDTVVSILSDLNGFWTYENREVFVPEDDGNS